MAGCVKTINALLPQTQCGECGFNGCMPYAKAIVNHQAPIDRCPPGGLVTIKALAQHLAIDPSPYLNSGQFVPRLPALALIREPECIGCTKCIQACPVDAIIGRAKQMHAILTTECTGCGLCVDPCPVDCIELVPIANATFDKERAKRRFDARNMRIANEKKAKEQSYQDKRQLSVAQTCDQEKKARQDYILAALKRVEIKKKLPVDYDNK